MHDIWGAPPPERKTDIAALDEKVLARALDTLILAVERHQPMSIEALLKAGVPTAASVKGVNAFEHLLTLAEASAEQHPEVLRALLAHAPPDAQVCRRRRHSPLSVALSTLSLSLARSLSLSGMKLRPPSRVA